MESILKIRSWLYIKIEVNKINAKNCLFNNFLGRL